MSKTPRAGSLREACILQSQTNTEVDTASCSVTYTDIAQVACSVENISPFAKVNSRGYTDALTHKVTIRWRPDIDISNIILYKDQQYGIANMTDVSNKRQYFHLFCYIIADKDAFQDPSPSLSGIFGDRW